MSSNEIHYKTIPALAAYIDRIGAEQLNFRRFMVKEYKGAYYRERSLIKITDEGDIVCSNKEHEPTKDEATAIKAALFQMKFPRSISTTSAKLKDLRELCGKDSTLYTFLNRAGEITFVQERAMWKGKKLYVPWTFWSDGVWRKMEPDGALPFWKPNAEPQRPKIMIHEGAKAAESIHSLIHLSKDYHPWREMLEQYEHWGMIGGALAPHRADYAELAAVKPTEVVYVCDNDFAGKQALQEVSRTYGGAMKGAMFDARWPLAWDMADPMPKHFFKGKHYNGPRLEDLLLGATFATERVPNPNGSKTNVTVMRPAFVEEWYHSVSPEVFIHRDWPNRILTLSEFDNTVRPFSHADATSRILKSDAASKSAVIKYTPAEKSGIFGSGDGGRFVNTHCPSTIPVSEADPSIFLDYMEHLCPDDGDRHELMRWCATLVACPNVKMMYGLLMITETQGVGKSTLGEKILAPLVGLGNTSFPNEQEIVDSNYNYWLAHKRLAVVHEIYSGHSSKAYNRLKSVVTDKYLTVSKKYQANYEIENWIHLYTCSNSLRALKLSDDDRRWFVPKLNEEKKPQAYWARLNQWLEEEGGLSAVRGYFIKWVHQHGAVQRGDTAPMSALKKEIVRENYSPGQQVVVGVLERVKAAATGEDEELKKKLVAAKQMRENGDCMIVDVDLVEEIKEELYGGKFVDRLEKPKTVRDVAKNAGWFPGKNDNKIHRGKYRPKTAGQRLICSSLALSLQKSAELFGEAVEASERLFPVDLASIREL